MRRRLVAFTALCGVLWLHCVVCSAQACSGNLALLLESTPELSEAARLLRSSESLWQQLKDPKSNLTLVVPVNDDLTTARSSEAWKAEANLDRTNNSDLALALYTILPSRFPSEADLAAAGSINTALGLRLRRDYPLQFSHNGSNSLAVQRPWDDKVPNREAVVLGQMNACNGVLYQVDHLITPSGYASDLMWERYGLTNTTIADAISSSCRNKNIVSVASNLEGRYIRQAKWGLYNLKPMLLDPDLSITIFIPTDKSLREVIADEAKYGLTLEDMYRFKRSDVDTLLYTMLPQAYCASELVQAGSLNSMVGQIRNRYLPLNFSLDPTTNQLVVKGISGPPGIVTNVLFACNSIIYLIDGFPMPFAVGNVTNEIKSSFLPNLAPMTTDELYKGSDNVPPAGANYTGIVPTELPSGFPRHEACLPPEQRRNPAYATLYGYIEGGTTLPPTNTTSDSGSGGGSNTGMIVGVVVGAVAAVAAALGAGLVVWRRRRARSQGDAAGKSDDGSVKLDVADAGGPSGRDGSRAAGWAAEARPTSLTATTGPSLLGVGDLLIDGRLFQMPSRPIGFNPTWEQAAVPAPAAKSPAGQAMLLTSPFMAGIPSLPANEGGTPLLTITPLKLPLAAGSQNSGQSSLGKSYGLGQLDLGTFSSTRISRGDSATLEGSPIVSTPTAASAARGGFLTGDDASSAPLSTTGSGGGMGLAGAPSGGLLESNWSAVFAEYAGGPAKGGQKAPERTFSSSQQLADSSAMSLWSSEFSGADWELCPQEIEICTHEDGALMELGSGSFGKVYKGMHNGETPVAVKFLSRDGQLNSVSNVRNEVEILKSCTNPNIVQFYGACFQGEWLMLVTEFMEGRDLGKSISLSSFRWYERGQHVALDVLRGLVYMHKNNMAHFDLKSNNILLDADGKAKISDMGLSKVLSNTYLSHTAAMGTFAWASPEQILGLRCTNKTDVYSYGVLLWELITGEVPLRGHLRPLQPPQDCPQSVVDLVESCLEVNPKLRPTAQEAYDLLLSIIQ